MTYVEGVRLVHSHARHGSGNNALECRYMSGILSDGDQTTSLRLLLISTDPLQSHISHLSSSFRTFSPSSRGFLTTSGSSFKSGDQPTNVASPPTGTRVGSKESFPARFFHPVWTIILHTTMVVSDTPILPCRRLRSPRNIRP